MPSRTALLVLLLTAIAEPSVRAVPSIPPQVGESAKLLQQTLDAAVAQRQATVTVQPGIYVFSDKGMNITGARDLAIHAEGATFQFYYGTGLLISDSHNVSVHGATFDADPPNYAQGIVTAVNSDATEFTAQFDDAFIPPDTSVPPFNAPGGSAGAKVAFWEPATRQMLYNVNFLNASSTVQGEPASFRIMLKHPQTDSGAKVGNLVTIFPRKGYTWQCANCSSVVADNVTIHAGGNMGFLETGGEGGNEYRNVAITRKPGGRGLMALNADGFHSSDVGLGPILKDSIISFTGDDFLNIHNRMKLVCSPLSTSGTTLTVIDPSSSLRDLRSGDELRFYDLLPHQPVIANPYIGRGVVDSVAVTTNTSLLKECRAAGNTIRQPPYNVFLIDVIEGELERAEVYSITFKDPLPGDVKRFSLVNFDRRSGSNFVVESNHFHDSCGSGGRIIGKAINGTLRNNVAERFGGIHVYSEQCWLEGALGIRNVLLENNVLVDARVANPKHVDVLTGLKNITCRNTTFVVGNNTTRRPTGC